MKNPDSPNVASKPKTELGPPVGPPPASGKTATIPLTIHYLHNQLDGQELKHLADYLQDPSRLTHKRPRWGLVDGTAAELWTVRSDPSAPAWKRFLENGFGDLRDVRPTSPNGAILLIEFLDGEAMHRFAITFGVGRFYLRDELIEPSFGRRVALNVIFPLDAAIGGNRFTRLRSVDAQRVEAITLRTRRQTSRSSDIAGFDLDESRDLMMGVVGSPERKEWGKQVVGGHSLQVGLPIQIGEVIEVCRRTLAEYGKNDYAANFAWVDQIRPVRDEGLRKQIDAAVAQAIAARSTDLYFAAPDFVDFSVVGGFAFGRSGQDRATLTAISEPTAADYLTYLGQRQVSLASLRVTDRLFSIPIDAADDQAPSWSAMKALCGELQINGKTIVLSEGKYFEVDIDYVAQLDAVIQEALEASEFPNAVTGESEGDYNKRVAASGGRLLLDQRFIQMPGRDRMELCDVFILDQATPNWTFVHVKKRTSSADLSHLFSQGAVAGELLVDNADFSDKVRTLLTAQDQAQGKQGTFAALFPAGAGFDARNARVVFAIVADWNRFQSPVKGLPFFSRVNLRQRIRDLHRLGFLVSWQRVQQP